MSYENQPYIGNSDAPVTLVEFGDFKCPSCKEFHGSVYPKLKKEYIDTGKVKMYFVNYAFLAPDSLTAAMIGESVYKQAPKAFWTYYDLVYTNQQKESEAWATPEFLLGLIKSHIPNVDTNEITQELKGNSLREIVEADRAIAKDNQVNSVPTIFINNKKIVLDDYNQIKQMIDKELQKK